MGCWWNSVGEVEWMLLLVGGRGGCCRVSEWLESSSSWMLGRDVG
jgi:hypothetical protein